MSAPTLAQLVSTYLERARTLNGTADMLQKAGYVTVAAGCRGEAYTYDLVARELTTAYLFPAPAGET